jgi:CubicO group peptidase (beta-lactamase class C family)
LTNQPESQFSKEPRIILRCGELCPSFWLIPANLHLTPLTRNLLTHTSGIAYDLGNPLLIQWRRYHGIELSLRGLPLVERAFCPLVFEPGTGWEYGYSLDWVGQIVSRVNGGISLQEYMKKNIWEPLQINNMTFHIEQRPDMWERLHRMSARDGPTNPIFGTSTAPSSAKVGPTDREVYEIPIVDEYGGHGVLSSAPDYFKVLRSIIVNDGGLLRPDTVDEMFKPQLGTASKAVLQNAFSVPELNRTFGWLPPNTGANWGLGGLLIEDDLPTGRKRGSMNWSGLPNLIWWIDRETGLYGLSATQLVPYGDEKFQAMHQAFETEMYSRYSELEKS